MTHHRLRELKVEVSRNCPLHCLHCSSNGMPGAPEHLEAHRISELVKEFASLGGEKLCISGGEPLCYEELSAIIESCRGSGIDPSLYTTGIIRNGGAPRPISETMAAFLADNGVKVIFSVHGACDKTHDLLTRVRGSFDSTMMAMERVINAGVVAEVHVVPTAINFNELVDITKLASSFNIDKISWLRFVPQGRGRLNRDVLQLDKDQLRGLTNTKAELEYICPGVRIRMGAPFNILCPQVPASCEAGVSELTISPDGFVSPCDAFKRLRTRDDFGSILHHSLDDVWHKSILLNSVRALSESKVSAPCALCSLFSKCGSGCLAQKTIAAGTLVNDMDPGCPLIGTEVVRDEIKAITVC
ncbi:MAG: radical SAM protein [Chloroflexi bacterium]|nr:radical SAM protein [Chloroflexota bacterium]